MLRRGSLRRAAARANSRRNHLCGRGGNPPDSPYELGGNHGSKRKITAESGAQEHSPSFLHEPPQAPHARGRGRGTRTTGRRWTTFARFTFALLVGRWRAFPVVFRLVLGSGQGGEASVCGGPASLCSLTPCPGPLAPLPRVIAPPGAPLTPRVSALRGDCSQGPRRGWFFYTTSANVADILPHGRISIASRPHQGNPWPGPSPHVDAIIPLDFPPFARDPCTSTG